MYIALLYSALLCHRESVMIRRLVLLLPASPESERLQRPERSPRVWCVGDEETKAKAKEKEKEIDLLVLGPLLRSRVRSSLMSSAASRPL